VRLASHRTRATKGRFALFFVLMLPQCAHGQPGLCPRPVMAHACVPPHQLLRVRGKESKPAGENIASPSDGARKNHCP
jgi:hypothetical protein